MAHAQEPKNRSHQSELRIQASADAMALLERAMQSLSQEAGRILSPGEALEYLAAEYLSRRPLDTAALEAARRARAGRFRAPSAGRCWCPGRHS